MKQSIPTLMIAMAEPVAIQSSTSDVLTIVIIGFTFVLFALLLLSLAVGGIGMLFTRLAPTESQPVIEKSKAPAVATDVREDEPNPQEIAVVAAAIHYVFGDQAHHIVSIRSSSSGWAEEGRRQIFTSRRVR